MEIFNIVYAWFDYDGDVNFNEINWSFTNPKLGISYNKSDNTVIYFNLGRTGREPTRYDMFQGYDVLEYICAIDTITGEYILPKLNTDAEYVTDYELGIRNTFNKLILNLNCYYLDFENERVLSGAYGPNGLALTSNVEKSIRTGVELFVSYTINENFKLVNNSSYNYSIIKEQGETFSPILTPPIIINQELIYTYKNTSVSLSARYQDQSYMNFENSEALNDYILINGRIDYNIKNYYLSVFINNITDNFLF